MGKSGGARLCREYRDFRGDNSPVFLPVFAPIFKIGFTCKKSGRKLGKLLGIFHGKAKGEYQLRKLHYKGRCTKRKLSKCKDVCRTYDRIQTAFADWLQDNTDIITFECNVKIENNSEDQYTSGGPDWSAD